MRLLVAAVAAGAGLIAYMADRSRSHSRRPPQPGNQDNSGGDAAAYGRKPAADEQPCRPTQQSLDSGSEARERERDARDAKHQLAERRFWVLGLVVSIAATAATGFAAWFAYGAYEAALKSVVETRRQADIAQQTLVATTRARLKLTAISDARVTRGSEIPLAWFTFKPAFKNFGQTPAQNITFSAHVFVIGTGEGLPARAICENEKARGGMSSGELVFPQEDGGENMFGTQVSLSQLVTQAAIIEEIQPSGTVYLGVVGCLLYQTIGSSTVYVTGLSGDLHPAQQASSDPEDYVPVYDLIVGSNPPVRIDMKISNLRAWAD